MQDVFVKKPYRFVPAFRGRMIPSLVKDFELFRGYLRRKEGVVGYECRNVERLKDSVQRGDSILLVPNHSRTADPMVMGWLVKEAHCLFYAMASWHLFNQGWFMHYALRTLGAFSVNREGMDRPAIDEAIRILESAERPLVVFPEGTASRVNDRLLPLMDGVSFIARTAAKRRKKKDGGRVIVHPIAIKYRFLGDLPATVTPVLTEIEQRLSWRPQSDRPLLQRIARLGEALLTLKELEYLGEVQTGTLIERQSNLINCLLGPIEQEWLGRPQDLGIIGRIKQLRMKILPGMLQEDVDPIEYARRWNQVEDTYLAQQIFCYPERYLEELPSVDRILETVERFEEDLTDRVRVHGSLKVIIDVDEPLVVSTERDRSAPEDPLMKAIRERIQLRLDALALESPRYEESRSREISS